VCLIKSLLIWVKFNLLLKINKVIKINKKIVTKYNIIFKIMIINNKLTILKDRNGMITNF
jgi:hypothetical protein